MKLPRSGLGLLCGVLFAASLRAADEPVDPDFLEFLGSVDSNDTGWHDYLASTDAEEGAQGGDSKETDPVPPPPANENGKVKPP